MRLLSQAFLCVAVLSGSTASADSTATSPFAPVPAASDPVVEQSIPDRLGPSASIAIGAGYSVAEGETGGVSVLALADLGWFVTDRFALLAGATIVGRTGHPGIHQNLWRLGVEYRLDARHFLRLSGGRSVLGRDRDDRDAEDGVQTIGKGEGALLVAGVPAALWRWGELSFQVDVGGAIYHGDDTESSYAGFIATCLELAVR
jgi:hypothetical protein